MDGINIIYKNEDFNYNSSFTCPVTETEISSYSYSGSQVEVDTQESEVRVLYFTRPQRVSFQDTPLFKLWRWMRSAFCIRKRRSSESVCSR